MLISELTRLSGTPAPTIKYYVRERLLPAGERTGGNRTEYGDEHVHRLRLIRALLEVGKLSIGSAGAVLAALDRPDQPIAETFEVAQRALARDAVTDVAEPSPEGLARVDALIERAGWSEWCHGNVGAGIAAQAIDAFASAGHPLPDHYLDAYAAAAEQVARADVGEVAGIRDPADRTELMVVGTVLGDTLSVGLRRIAQAHITAERNLS
ncbi:MerR family transcriptional regulator [Herbiconiux daphne]|uniref:MerR family transcriptional regulator n=1 Tax=Herbiconiux daphne TaxID=2970914 RepID=A0ABT2H4R6_9MICO|nr:MerR family transcriptional regulator [Herbiconiux daphne]MCS5734925.1 MerR family transcriptional regulator [Herbiconiux daphne]